MIMLNSLRRTASVGLGAIMAVALLTSASQAQQAYPSPEDAAAALVAAVKTGTRSTILKVLGKDAADIIESGDDVADAEMRQRFLSAYDAKHSIKAEENKKATLILGADDFPFPIPLVNSRTGWEFDPAAGRLEILYRRIGRNELEREWVPTHNASSVAPARRMGCSGATIATQARLANWRRKHRPKGTRSRSRRPPIMAIIIEF
jgi:Protein of unknown function (DUF2950)